MTVRRFALKSIVAAVAILLAVACPSDGQEKSAKVEDPMRGEKAGQVRDDNGLKMKFVWCPPGVFEMGEVEEVVVMAADDEEEGDEPEVLEERENEPQTVAVIRPVKVFLTRGYWLGKYEVTQREWKQVMQTEPWQRRALVKEGDDFPATCLDWHDAMEFCRKLTQQEREAGRLPGGWEYSLPTEAQWERACRARTSTTYSFGDDESELGEYAWFDDNVGNDHFAHRVGQKRPNPWGLHDMHGNVFEWCRDAYNEWLPGGRDPEVKAGYLRVGKNGSWFLEASNCRSACRCGNRPVNQYFNLGFRVALSSVQPVQPASGAGSGGPEGARR